MYGVEACPDGYREYDLFPEDDDPTRLATVHGDWLTELGGVFDLGQPAELSPAGRIIKVEWDDGEAVRLRGSRRRVR